MILFVGSVPGRKSVPLEKRNMGSRIIRILTHFWKSSDAKYIRILTFHGVKVKRNASCLLFSRLQIYFK